VCVFFYAIHSWKKDRGLLGIQHWQKVIFSHKRRNVFVKKQLLLKFYLRALFVFKCSVGCLNWIIHFFVCLCQHIYDEKMVLCFSSTAFWGQCFVFQEITQLQEHTFKNFLSIHCCSNQEKCCLLWCLGSFCLLCFAL
jgi:hypothetical protein